MFIISTCDHAGIQCIGCLSRESRHDNKKYKVVKFIIFILTISNRLVDKTIFFQTNNMIFFDFFCKAYMLRVKFNNMCVVSHQRP